MFDFQKKCMEYAKEQGFQAVETYGEQSTSLSLKVFQGEVDAYETSDEGGVKLRIIENGQAGEAYTEKLDASSFSFLVESAKNNAAILSGDTALLPFEGSESYHSGSYFEPTLENIKPAVLTDILLKLEHAILQMDDRVTKVTHCGASLSKVERILMNSSGLEQREQKNGLVIYAGALAEQGEEKKSGFVTRIIHRFEQLNVEEIAREVVEKAIANLGGETIPSRTYPVILQNEAASSFLSVFLSSFSAEQVEKGQSRLVNQLNEQIASSVLTIIDDPHDANAYHRTNFDAEGVATQQQTIIKDGCLKTYLHSRKSAKRFGVEPTGHAAQYSYKGSIVIAPHQFVVATGEATKEELINDLQNGVLITNLTGLHAGANEVSGDFSLAANGLYIEQGQIKHAIKQMTIAGNFFDLLQEIHRVGNDCYYGFSRVSSPSLVFSALPITVEE